MTQKTALLFAGQGAQYVGMGRDFAEQCPSCQKMVRSQPGNARLRSAIHLFQRPGGGIDPHGKRAARHFPRQLDRVAIAARSGCPEMEYQAAAGLSLGELTALTAAEVFTFEDGLRIARQRGRFMQEACELTVGEHGGRSWPGHRKNARRLRRGPCGHGQSQLPGPNRHFRRIREGRSKPANWPKPPAPNGPSCCRWRAPITPGSMASAQPKVEAMLNARGDE